MNAAVKLLGGAVLLLIGLWLLVPASVMAKPACLGRLDCFNCFGDFVTVMKGMIPPALIMFGVLICWIEAEELKTSTDEIIPEIEIEKPRKKKAGRPRKVK